MEALGGYDGSDPGNDLKVHVASKVHQEEGGTRNGEMLLLSQMYYQLGQKQEHVLKGAPTRTNRDNG